jgi:site-specific DNA-cytosine methylase
VQDAAQGHLMPIWPAEVAPTIDAHFGDKQGLENQHINGGGGCLPLVSKCLITKVRIDAESETLIPITGGHFSYESIPIDTMNIRGRPSDDGRANRIGRGYGEVGDPMFTITKANHHGVVQPIAFSGQMSNPQTDVDMTQTLGAKNPMAVAQPVYELHSQDSRVRELGDVCTTVSAAYGAGGRNVPITLLQAMATHDVAGTMLSRNTSGGFSNSIDHAAAGYMAIQAMAVRRLTPVECERLQGFGDHYTDIKPKGKPTPDGPRYKALGNSMAVPVMAWIGKRIQQVNALL